MTRTPYEAYVTGVHRRDFLRAVAVVAAPGLLEACGDGERSAQPITRGPVYFPLSVASGDPRPTSVVVWTRVEDADFEEADFPLELEVALDEGFRDRIALDGGETVALTALGSDGGCVKARLEGLDAGTTYYYRFTYLRGDERHASRVGRTRTAPEPDADVSVRFAVVSCQDYADKYFHVLRYVAAQPLDFVLHLGDYVYETTRTTSGDGAGRAVVFRQPEQALSLSGGVIGDDAPSEAVLAARSLDNYRDLYRTARSDPDLQKVHELFPMIAIPDDHEFSNDCYGATATYEDGRENEEDFERRRNADRAWFEFMPFDDETAPAAALDETAAFPDDFRLYRRFELGRHVELVLTDLRRYRPDHVVPEDAFPGAMFLTKSDALDLLGEVPDDAVPYVDIDDDAWNTVRDALLAAADDQNVEPARVTGLLSAPWVNGIIEGAGGDPPIDLDDTSLERGYAYHQLLKTSPYSSVGSRYLVAEGPFRALAALRAKASDGESERLMGDEQRRWFLDTMKGSTRTWKLWGNEYTLMRRRIDLTGILFAPQQYQQKILLSGEDWDGAPNERDALLDELADVENVAVFTGDLHAFFAGTPYPEGNEGARVVEFVSGSISSTTWLTGIQSAIASDPTIPAEAALLAGAVGTLLQDPASRPNPHIGWLDLVKNGCALVTAGAEALEVTFVTLDDELVTKPPAELPAPIAELVTNLDFRVRTGTRDLEQRIDGTFRTWDRDALDWV